MHNESQHCVGTWGFARMQTRKLKQWLTAKPARWLENRIQKHIIEKTKVWEFLLENTSMSNIDFAILLPDVNSKARAGMLSSMAQAGWIYKVKCNSPLRRSTAYRLNGGISEAPQDFLTRKKGK